MEKEQYIHAIPDYGDLMTVQEWLECVEGGMFIDYDGHGRPAKDGLMSSMFISPSRARSIPIDATHIVWFNR